MHLAHIYRHPVKGMTPEELSAATLTSGAGIAFDRCCGFTSGNLPDAPAKGGWVPARTFIQLTVYPGLARFRARLDEERGAIHLTAPDGESAEALLDQPASTGAVDALIGRHFAAGPHGRPGLHVQSRPKGHWDFTDSGISLLNLASLRALESAAGEAIDPRRFRANLHFEGFGPWAEFGLVGGRYRLAGAIIDVMRPAMRCAATAADPDTGDTGLNVPALLRTTTGHLFFAVYARVVETGRVAPGDRLERIADAPTPPQDDLPPRAPDPRMWPRVLDAEAADDGLLRLSSPLAGWPLTAASAGQTLLLHPGLANGNGFARLRIERADAHSLTVAAPGTLTLASDRIQLLCSGPLSQERT